LAAVIRQDCLKEAFYVALPPTVRLSSSFSIDMGAERADVTRLLDRWLIHLDGIELEARKQGCVRMTRCFRHQAHSPMIVAQNARPIPVNPCDARHKSCSTSIFPRNRTHIGQSGRIVDTRDRAMSSAHGKIPGGSWCIKVQY
jgi:hypothetical protein